MSATSDKHIPTLDEVVVPGDKDLVEEKAFFNIESQQSPDTAAEAPQGQARRHTDRTAFEAMVEAIVTGIMKRHMEEARTEITDAILKEIRTRLPKTRQQNKPQDK